MVALSAETWEISMSALSQHSACNTFWDILSPIRVAGMTVGIFWIQGENWGWPLQNYRHGTNHTLHSLKNPGRQPHFFNALLSYCTFFLVLKNLTPHTLTLSDTNMLAQVYVPKKNGSFTGRRDCPTEAIRNHGEKKQSISNHSSTFKRRNVDQACSANTCFTPIGVVSLLDWTK